MVDACLIAVQEASLGDWERKEAGLAARMRNCARGVGEHDEDVIGRERIGWKRQLSVAVRRECSDLANMIVVDVVINGNG